MRRYALMHLAVTALACSAPRPREVNSVPVVADVDARVEDVVALPAVSDVPPRPVDAATAEPAVVERESPDPRGLLLRALAAGTVPLSQAIDPTRGVTVVRHIEAPPAGGGRARISDRRLCGTALTRALPALRRDLVEAVQQAGEDAISCDAEGVCHVSGMEYQPAWQISFVDVQGTPRLEAVAQVSLAAMNDDWVDAVNAHIHRALRTARGRPCPAR